MTNRVVVDKAVNVQSVNGPQFTSITGYQVPGATNGSSAIRCVYLADGATLSGFTISGGATLTTSDIGRAQSGGGVWCNSTLATVLNCVISGNSAGFDGGGASSGTFVNCVFANNSAIEGGGAYTATLNNCTLTNNSGSSGGGAFSSTLTGCVLAGNSGDYGGGANAATLLNCKLSGNSAVSFGGGSYFGILINCTVVGNSATNAGGGTYGSTLTNCIVYFNTCPNGSNFDLNSSLTYCCASPLAAGPLNIASDPLFVDLAGGNLRLQSNSPCVNVGLNSVVTTSTDLDGRPRIIGSVDLGAYEFQGPFNAWLAQYGLPTDGSADFVDSDHDGMNNWQEWRCGTNPTNALSVLRMFPLVPSGSNIKVSWQSVAGINYFLERSAVVGSPGSFISIATNLSGSTGTLLYTDTNPPPSARLFYRVGVGN
jgi:hypothetical protein